MRFMFLRLVLLLQEVHTALEQLETRARQEAQQGDTSLAPIGHAGACSLFDMPPLSM